MIEVEKSGAKRGICKKCPKMNGIAKKQDKHEKFLAEMPDGQVDFLAGMHNTNLYFAGEKNDKRQIQNYMGVGKRH